MSPISLVSWNLLAPTFATPAKYPWASAEHLAWPGRQRRIVDMLAEIDADVICLQEVETAMWSELLRRLRKLGYDGVLQQTRGGHPVANAVCVRRDALEVVRTESRSRALITVLRACGEHGDGRASGAGASVPALPPRPPPLYLANVHLEAGAEKSPQRLAQVRSLLRRVELQRAIDVADAQGRRTLLSPVSDAAGAALVLTGDFNFDRSSELHALLATGSLPPGGGGGGGRKQRSTARHALLPLRDAYLDAQPPWGPRLRSTYRNGRLLDFVWTSPAVEVLRTMPVSELAGSMQPHQLPSATHPSDHLPIGALLTWAGEATGEPSRGARGPRPAWQQLNVENVVQQRRG